MPAKLTVICYAHNCTDRQTRDYTIKEVTGVVRMNDDEPTDVIYLRIKAFIPTDRSIKSKIEEFESGQVIFVRGKFIGCEGWYTVRCRNNYLENLFILLRNLIKFIFFTVLLNFFLLI